MKKFLLGAASVLVVAVILVQLGVVPDWNLKNLFGKDDDGSQPKTGMQRQVTEGISYGVKAEGNYFYIYQNGKWEKLFMKGVNIGAGQPGIFPGELTISYEDYLRWFQYISEMNANCIRVYTAMRPQFYTALRDFNQTAEQKLYLFQGVWMNESDITSLSDVYADNERIMTEFLQDAKNLVDVIHGSATLPARAGYASGTYTADVSDYLAGWVMGIEWDPKFVQNTNVKNSDRSSYDGDYMYTLSATPFEAFLCGVGDQLISYETGKYKTQSPVAFTNWVTTDPLAHPNEPHPDEDLISVNTENIRTRPAFYPGMFASYHIYPYYPDSLNYQEDYLSYRDSDGQVNTYEAYLSDLKSAHTVPILVAEFGIPTSRGMAHENVMGMNQGRVDEIEQGNMLMRLFRSIYDAKYAGGLSFTWQDEWFKRTWNNEALDVADKRPFWSNVQTNEQSFGILAFDPGEKSTKITVDGDISDWQGLEPAVAGDAGSLTVTGDERYLYLLIQPDGYRFDTDTLLVPVDTLEGQGNRTSSEYGASFDGGADFLLVINGRDNTRLLVDRYYDTFQFLYGEQYKMIPAISDIRRKNTGIFSPMRMCFGYEMTVPPRNTLVPFRSYETGKLTFGNSNPAASDYRSLTDFCGGNSAVEVRIPWQLLNVMDPSGKKIVDDLYTVQNISPVSAGAFRFGLGRRDASISLTGQYSWDGWIVPNYHERLKPSYYVLQSGLKNLR